MYLLQVFTANNKLSAVSVALKRLIKLSCK